MTCRTLSSLALLCVLAATVRAHHPPAVEPDCPGPPPERIVEKRQMLLVPHEEATTLPRLALREVEVGRIPGLALDFLEKIQTITEMKLQECEVIEPVVCTEARPVEKIDPCTGRCYVDYEPCEVVKMVKVKKYKPVPVCRQVVVRVPVLRPGRPLAVKKLVAIPTSVPAIKTKYSLAETTNAISVPRVAPPPCLRPAPCHVPHTPLMDHLEE